MSTRKKIDEAFGVRDTVFRSLNNAVDNGYEDFVLNKPVNKVADDLLTYDAEVEHLGAEQDAVMSAICDWRMDFCKKKRRESGHTGKVDRGPLPGAQPGT